MLYAWEKKWYDIVWDAKEIKYIYLQRGKISTLAHLVLLADLIIKMVCGGEAGEYQIYFHMYGGLIDTRPKKWTKHAAFRQKTTNLRRIDKTKKPSWVLFNEQSKQFT